MNDSRRWNSGKGLIGFNDGKDERSLKLCNREAAYRSRLRGVGRQLGQVWQGLVLAVFQVMSS